MTPLCPYPEANPFNTCRFGNYNVGKAASGFYISHTGKEAKNLQVPNQDQPMYGSPEWAALHDRQKGLTVPDTAPDAMLGGTASAAGFVPGRPDLFVMHDGAVISFKTGRIVRPPPPRSGAISPSSPGQGEWGATPSIEQLMAGIGVSSGKPAEDPNIDEYSRKYWEMAAQEARKLESSMTPEQKFHLQAFETHFPKSRLIDESKKSH